MGIPASQRLRKPSEFQQVRSSKHRLHCGAFIVQGSRDEHSDGLLPKLGVIASRRVGNAVKRNRGKRLVREIFRRHAADLPRDWRIVVVLRAGFDRHSFAELEAQFIKACGRILPERILGEESKP